MFTSLELTSLSWHLSCLNLSTLIWKVLCRLSTPMLCLLAMSPSAGIGQAHQPLHLISQFPVVQLSTVTYGSGLFGLLVGSIVPGRPATAGIFHLQIHPPTPKISVLTPPGWHPDRAPSPQQTTGSARPLTRSATGTLIVTWFHQIDAGWHVAPGSSKPLIPPTIWL